MSKQVNKGCDFLKHLISPENELQLSYLNAVPCKKVVTLMTLKE